MTEPAKCPICGSEAECDGDYGRCSNIDCRIMGPTKDNAADALKAWNTLCEQIRVGSAVVELTRNGQEGDCSVWNGVIGDYEVAMAVELKHLIPEEPPTPELTDEELKDVFGFSITLVTSAKTKEEAEALLRHIGLPLQKKEVETA